MACKCVNPDGSLAQTCNGRCGPEKEYREQNAVKERSDKSIEDRFEYILGTFLQKLDDRIDKLISISMEKYKQGYRDGFNDGQSGY